MRTTLTLDPDVARLIEEEARRQRRPIKQVVNDALRRGLSPRALAHSNRRYDVSPHKTTLRTGIDAGSFNRLADELEDEALAEKMRASR